MNTVAKGIVGFWHVVVAAGSFVSEVVHAVVAPVFVAAGAVAELAFMIPVVGSLSRQVWNLAAEAVWRLAGAVDFLVGLLGVRPEKKLRVRVVILRDERGNPVATPERVLQDVRSMIDIYAEEANVRVVPVGWVRLSTPFAAKEKADDRYVVTASGPSSRTLLDVDCSVVAWFKDVLYRGAMFHYRLWRHGVWGTARRLLGYGSPLTVFVVRDIDGAVGCSFGPLTDYVVMTTGAPDDTTMAHEIGHSCGLPDVSKSGTLMGCPTGTCAPTMSRLQALVLRNSRHVTYF